MNKKLVTILLGTCLTLAVQAVQTVTEYDFSTYNDGPLAGQEGWVQSTHYVSNGVLNFTNTNDWNTARQSVTFDNVNNVEDFIVSADWSFTETSATFNNQQFFNFLFTDDTSSGGPVSFRPAIQKHSAAAPGTYAIRLFSPAGAVGPSYINFPEERMGLDTLGGTDWESDRLRMTLRMTRGTNETDWTYLMSLDNVDTGENCAHSTGTASSDLLYYTTNSWALFVGNAQATETTATDVKVYNMKVVQTTSDTIVQWADLPPYLSTEKGLGTTDIVPGSSTDWIAQFGSYNLGTNMNPAVGGGYYPNNTGRSPVFNGALKASNSSLAQIGDNATTGDFFNTGANTNHFEVMVAWETFLEPNTELTGLEMRMKSASVEATNSAQARFIIRKDGSWYASEAYDIIADHFAWAQSMFIAPDPMALTWYDFEPIVNGSATIGSVAALSDLEGIDIVGYYGAFDDGVDSNTWSAVQCGYFRATADPTLTLWEEFVQKYELSGVETDNADGDVLNDYEEFVFIGIPTNSADIGILPTLDPVFGVYSFSVVGDGSLKAYVLKTDMLTASTSWTTNEVIDITFNDGLPHAYNSVVGTVGDEQFVKVIVE